jgi:hypothetical protein
MVEEGYYYLNKDFYNFPAGTIFKAIITNFKPIPSIYMQGTTYVEFCIISCKRDIRANPIYVSGDSLEEFKKYIDKISEDEVMIANIIL